jgi:hypothetical protein
MGFRTPGHAGRHQHADHWDLGHGHDEREPDGRGQHRTEGLGSGAGRLFSAPAGLPHVHVAGQRGAEQGQAPVTTSGAAPAPGPGWR